MHKAAGLQGLPKLRGGYSRELHYGLQDATVRTLSKHRQTVNSLWLYWGVAVTYAGVLDIVCSRLSVHHISCYGPVETSSSFYAR